jgi:hypothetical protein
MAKGDRITTAAFNNLQTSTRTVLGVGSGQDGYGQTVVSSPVSSSSVVSASQWNNLRADMRKCWQHQTNTDISDTLASVSTLPPNLQSITNSTIISDAILTQYTNFTTNGSSTGIVQRKTTHAAGQLDSTIVLATTTRDYGTTAGAGWRTTIQQEATLTFAGYTATGGAVISAADHMRCFFNAGGSIELTVTRTGGDTAGSAPTKNTVWANLLSQFGTFSFKGTTSTVSGTRNGGTAPTLGWHNLAFSGTPTTIMSNTGAAGFYAENDFVVQVNKPVVGSSNQLVFTLLWRDNDTGDAPVVNDEFVNGVITTTFRCTRPIGSYVAIPAPTIVAGAIG